MECNTSALCDLYEDEVEVVEPVFRSFGGSSSFCGSVVTVSCYESNGLIRSALSEDGTGKVLVIDAGGSMRRAVIDADIACTAYDSGWEGLIVFGAVREISSLRRTSVGIQALGSVPMGADEGNGGDTMENVRFGGVTFRPGMFVYADETGIVVSGKELETDDSLGYEETER